MANSLARCIQTLQDVAEPHQLHLDRQSPSKLVLRQNLKPWAYAFIMVWATLFTGIPIGLTGLVAAELGIKTSSCLVDEPAPASAPASTPQINCEEEPRWNPQFWGLLLLMAPFVLIGLFVAYGSLRSRTLILDKTHHLYTRKVYTPLGLRVSTYPLDEIRSITTKEYRRHHRGRVYKAYQLQMHLHHHGKHQLPGIRNRQTVSHAVAQMQSFLESSRLKPPSSDGLEGK
ncbi:MAG: hypothetical protein AAF152_13730 [Cyanobacteria bacterium P01_A01_bin.114]